ncbi:MAG TPA: SCO family protein [Candidatus Kapabacteria bacterium]|jgi:protein SCO1/2
MVTRTSQRIVWTLLSISLLLVAGFAIAKWQGDHLRHLDDFGTVPDFSLVDQNGHAASLTNFRGHIWIADMIFTHCGSICPTLTSKMLALQNLLKDKPDVRFASISVDPKHDTPDTLRNYAAAHHADIAKWTFLTGTTASVYQIVKGGFHLPLDSIGGEQRVPIIHSPRFALVDARGHIRGYYNAIEPGSQKSIIADIDALEHEQNQ